MFWTVFTILGGSFLIVGGCRMWLKGNVSILKSSFYDKVSEENKKSFCRLSGFGFITMGLAPLLGVAIIFGTDASVWGAIGSIIAIAAVFFAGFLMVHYAKEKYNR